MGSDTVMAPDIFYFTYQDVGAVVFKCVSRGLFT